ncbi:MAG: glycine cleavage system protein GcvH [Candidatus Bathyarchaeia archaeon]
MQVGEYEVREKLYYTREHDWVKLEGELCRVGISDFAQKSLHEIVYAELPKVGLRVRQMESMGTVESVKAVSDVFSPVTGEVLEVNEKLSEQPELINKSPYDDGWIAVIKPENLEEELNNLLDHNSYAKYLEELLKE